MLLNSTDIILLPLALLSDRIQCRCSPLEYQLFNKFENSGLEKVLFPDNYITLVLTQKE